MKTIHYLSIQGRYAPSFWFKNRDAQNFRSLVESITLHRALVISSIYRTDLFYFAEKENSELIIRTWCTFKGHHYDEHMKSKFIRADNKADAFEFYFDTLFHLMHHPNYYDRYKERLNELQQQEKNNTILNELMQCDLHLSECYKEQHVEYRQLTSELDTEKHNSPGYEGFRNLAGKSFQKLNYN